MNKYSTFMYVFKIIRDILKKRLSIKPIKYKISTVNCFDKTYKIDNL